MILRKKPFSNPPTIAKFSVAFIFCFVIFLSAPSAFAVEVHLISNSGSPLPGINIYAFTSSGAYSGNNATTDAEGKAYFNAGDLTGGQFRFRADYLGYQFWSEDSLIQETSIIPLAIDQLPVNVTVNSDYQGTAAPLEGVPIYVFKDGGAYMNLNATTDAGGTVTFNLPQQAYKFRADYFGTQYWTDSVPWQDKAVEIPLAEAEVSVTGMGLQLENVSVYVFRTSGAYLGRNGTTDVDGKVTFRIPAGEYKFRADYQGSQYWSADQQLVAGQINPVGISSGGGVFEFTVLRGVSDPLAGVNCYLFTEGGSYLNQTAVTDAQGKVTFPLADGTYKIRTDFQGYQYWSDVYTVPDTLIGEVTIAHQPVVITVKSDYQGTEVPLEGVPIYVFKDGGAYMNLNATTDAGGTVTFNLPQQAYKFRADYFGTQYWTDSVPWQDKAVEIPLAEAEVSVTGMGLQLENVSVYVFRTSGAYLGRTGTTDVDGKVTFRIPAGEYKFRADYQGSQYWSSDQPLVAGQVNPVGISTGGGIFEFTVLRGVSDPLAGVNCYLFTEGGSYLNQTAVTDAQGKVTFPLADGTYKIRTDYNGYQYWSDVYTVPDVLSDVVTIAHQATTISVVSTYPESTVHEGLPVYLFTSAGSYLGQSRTTDINGQAAFYLPDRAYKVRVDYMSRQFWSEEFNFENVTVTIPMGTAQVHVSRLDTDVQNASVYLFTESGSYLNRVQTTGGAGTADFVVPAGTLKFRVDYDGRQYWSPVVDILENQVNTVAVDVSPLSVTLTAEPATITAGEQAQLTWTSKQATSATIDNGIGAVAVNGNLSVTPSATTTYTITVEGPEGTQSAGATVTVNAAPSASIRVIEPDGIADSSDAAFAILWQGSYSPDYRISLYYDVDNTGYDGTLIAGDLAGNGDGTTIDEYLWNTSGTPEGAYYIYAVADNGQGQAVQSYSTFPLVVDHTIPPLVQNEFEVQEAYHQYEGDDAPVLHINGDYAILGANGNGEDIPGSAHIFHKTDLGWEYQTSLSKTDSGDQALSIELEVADNNGEVPHLMDMNYTSAKEAWLDFEWGVDIDQIAFRRAGGEEGFLPDVNIKKIEFLVDGTWMNRTGNALWSPGGDLSYVSGTGWLWSGDYGRLQVMGTWAQGFRPTQIRVEFEQAVTDDGSKFGHSVAISKDFVVIGAPGSNNSTGTAYVYKRIGNAWLQEAELLAPDGLDNDQFGKHVAISGDRIAVGQPYRSGGEGSLSGAVYIFEKGVAGWTDSAKLQAEDMSVGSVVVDSIALHGDYLLFGAPYADTEIGPNTGVAYMFHHDGEGWVQQGRLEADDTSSHLYFGSSVSLDGHTAIIGAVESAYVYHLTEAGWSQQAKLISFGNQDNAGFGRSVAINGDFAVIGAPDDNIQETYQGSVYIYKREGSASWVQYQRVTAVQAGATDAFGRYVSISDNCIMTTEEGGEFSEAAYFLWLRIPAIRLLQPDGIFNRADSEFTIKWVDYDNEENASIALYYDLNGDGADGMLIVEGLMEDPDSELDDQYVWDTSEVPAGSYFIYAVIDDGVHNPVVSYSHVPVVIDHTPPASIEGLQVTPEGGGSAYFGRSVAIDGDYAVIGTEHDRAYVYHFDGTSWILQAELTSSNTIGASAFGWDVDIQGNTVIVGARTDGEMGHLAGAAFVFEREGENWVEKQKLTAGNTDADDGFGVSVALDNGYAIVGAYAKYDVRGTAYVFMRAEEGWIQTGELNVADLAPYAMYGQEVAISGNYAVISARYQRDGNGEQTGAAYIFKSGEGWTLEKTLWPGELGGAYDFVGPVSIDGDTVAIQVYSVDGTAATVFYNRDSEGFWQQPEVQPTGTSENNYFHNMVLKGGYLATSTCKSATLFRQGDPGWDETAQLHSNDSDQCRYLSLDISDGWVIVGSSRETSAYFYPLVFAEMEANPATIQAGESATLQWNSTHANVVEIDQGIGPVGLNGSVSVTPLETTTYKLTANGSQGTAHAFATVSFPPPFVTLAADPPHIPFDGAAALSWQAVNAETVTIDQGIGAVALEGTTTVTPTQDTTYTVTAAGPGGTATTYVRVKLPPVKVTIDADPHYIKVGETTTLSWTTLNGDSCTIEPGIGAVALSGTQTVSPAENTPYTIQATGPGEADSDTVTVIVDSTSPSVTQMEPAQGSTVYTAGNSLDLRITYSDDNAGICSERLFDAEGNDITAQANFAEGVLTLNVTGLTEGEYRYTLELVDCSGNVLQQEVSFNVGLISGLDNGFDFDEQQGGGGLVGDTVRILNGNVVEFRSDLAFPSPHRHGLVFNAAYNSRSNRIGALGHGWTHTYDVRLQAIGDGQVKIEDATGRLRFFQNQGEGYQGLFNEKSRLESTGEGYLWKLPNGLEYGFNGSGQLDYIDDEIGNRLELTYIEGRLSAVTDTATSRQLDFNYGEMYLSSIGGPMSPALGEGNTWLSFGYDGHQNLTGVYYADGSGFNYVYLDPNDPNNLSERRNLAGHLLASWEYDTNDRCVEHFNTQGQGFAESNYVSDDLVEITDDYGNLRSYTLSDVNGRKRVAAMSGPAAGGYITSPFVRWDYDDAMNLVEVETAGGTVHRYQSHDTRGNPRTVVLAADSEQQRIISYTWHPDFNRPLTRTEDSVLGEGDKETVWDYDSDGNDVANEAPGATVTRLIERGFTADMEGTSVPYEYITTYTYNEYGQLISVDGPLTGEVSDVTSYYYHEDSSRNLYAIDQPIIGMTTFSGYDAAGNVGLVTDVNAQSRSFEYDGRNRITRVTHEADGSSSSIQYNTAGFKDRTVDEDDISQTYSYDPEYGRLERTTDFTGNYIANSYNFQGDLIERGYYDPEGTLSSRKQYAFTGDGHTLPGLLYHQLNPDGTYVEYRYNNEGRVSEVKDARDNTTGYQYDVFGRVAQMIQPGEGNIYTYYGYDLHGNLNSVIDGNNAETTYTHDDMGRLCTTVSPDTGTTRRVYDATGNLVEKMDAKGTVVSYEYDGLNRMRYINFPDANQNIAYTYDEELHGKGRLTGMTDPSGSTRYYYDINGRLSEKTATVFGQDYTFSRTFTPGGRLSKVIYPSGRLLDFDRRTCQCNVDGIYTSFGEGEQVTLMDNLNYSPFGAAKSAETGSGGTVANTNDENARLSVANQGEPREHKLEYDGNGNLEKIEYASLPWQNQYYSYDALNRLTQADGPYGRFNYTYDNVGNRQSKSNYTAGQQNNYIYEYEVGNNLIDRITGPQNDYFSHDENGNITSMRGMTLTYNQNNRLVRIEQEGSLIGEYVYNGSGQRIIKTVEGVDTIFLYDFDGNIVAEYFGDGTLKAEYLYRGSNRLAKADGSTGEIFFYQNDRLGTPIALTDSNNESVWEAMYLPHGEAIVNPNATVENNFRFPGQYYDTESGLHYNYFRYYDPSLGRYITSDPIGLAGGINLFSYSGNNPIVWTDPLGLLRIVSFREGATGESAYRAQVSVYNTETKKTEYQGKGSTLPNRPGQQSTIDEGVYSGRVTEMDTKNRPGIFLFGADQNDPLSTDPNSGNRIPTVSGSPNSFAAGVFVHKGKSSTIRGSEACLTIDPDTSDDFFNLFGPEEYVHVVIIRGGM